MKNLTFLLLCLPFFAKATSQLEEGIILQNELRFLEEVSRAEFSAPTVNQNESALNATNDLDLESTYFNNQRDEIQTRSSAPRRRVP